MICLLAFVSVAQTNKRPRFFCAYGEGSKGAELCKMAQASSFTSNEVAERAIEKVLRPLGLKRNFVILSCPDIDNAAAVTYDDGVRYIVYDNAFMTKVDRVSNTDWASLSILAHELGHHLQGHTTGKSNFPPSAEELERSRTRELEADEFSGFVMYKLGATLAQAQSAMSNLRDVDNEEYSTHPKRALRLASIQAGYEEAASQQPLANVSRGPSAEEFFSKAYDFYEKKNYRAAIDTYTAAIALNPNFAASYNNRGIAKQIGYKRYKGAMEDYTEAIRLKPDYTDAYNNRGNIKFEVHKDYKGAIEDYNEAIRLKPDFAEPYHNRGLVKQKGYNDYTGALDDYNEAIRLKPAYADAYYNRGVVKHIHYKDHKGAIEDYNQAIRLKPGDAIAYSGRGNVKQEGYKDYKGAIEDYNEAIRLKPDFADAYHNRGLARHNGYNDYKGAMEDYTEAMRLKPAYPEAYHNRGVAKSQLGDTAGACEDYRKACSLGFSPSCTAAGSCQ